VQTEALQIIDEIVARGDGGKEVTHFGGPLLSRLIEFIAHAAKSNPVMMHPLRLWGKFTVEEKTGNRAAGPGSGFFIQNLLQDKKLEYGINLLV
jgi:hypothetical protein